MYRTVYRVIYTYYAEDEDDSLSRSMCIATAKWHEDVNDVNALKSSTINIECIGTKSKEESQ